MSDISHIATYNSKGEITNLREETQAEKALKIAQAHVDLSKQLFSRTAWQDMIEKHSKTGEITAPGSRYVGPFNELPDKLGRPGSQPRSGDDLAAYRHDTDYDRYIKSGMKPWDVYTGFSDADERLMGRSNPRHPHGLITYYGMGAKKISSKLGLGPRLREQDMDYGAIDPNLSRSERLRSK